MALGLPSEQAGPQALQQVRTAGASAAIVPASSLRTDPSATVTPSSIALHRQAGSGEDLPLLAPDPELSAEFSQLTGQSDAEQTRQRLLAEAATIAAEYTTAPRHLLIVPDPEDQQVTGRGRDRKSTRLNSNHVAISYAAFCL